MLIMYWLLIIDLTSKEDQCLIDHLNQVYPIHILSLAFLEIFVLDHVTSKQYLIDKKDLKQFFKLLFLSSLLQLHDQYDSTFFLCVYFNCHLIHPHLCLNLAYLQRILVSTEPKSVKLLLFQFFKVLIHHNIVQYTRIQP